MSAQPPPLPPSQGPSCRRAPPPQDDPSIRLLLPVGRSGWAIAAGYLGLFSVLLAPAPLALLCGIQAIRSIRKSRERAEGQEGVEPKYGMGRAVFGVVMGFSGTVILLILLLAVVSNR